MDATEARLMPDDADTIRARIGQENAERIERETAARFQRESELGVFDPEQWRNEVANAIAAQIRRHDGLMTAIARVDRGAHEVPIYRPVQGEPRGSEEPTNH